MSTADVTISCPHCRRQYKLKIDPERLKRLKTRATCRRCGNTFDVASRVVPASEATTDPKLPRIAAAPLSMAQLVPTPSSKASPSSVTTIPDLNDEMEELAREFAEAAARFTPVNVKRPAAVTAPAEEPAAPPSPTNPEVPLVLEPPPSLAAPSSTSPDVPLVLEPPPPLAAPSRSLAEAPPAGAPIEPPPTDNDVAAAYDQLSLEPEPAAAAELAPAVPTQPRARAVPRSWLELADPGLAALEPPPSPGAAALEALLNESERIALPTAAS